MRLIKHRANWFFYCTLFSGLALLASCEEIIDPPFEIERPKLIISSNFSPDTTVSVRLTASQSIVGERSVREITNANVTLIEGNEVVEKLHFVPGVNGEPGVYRTASFIPVVGRLYTLHAAADGYDVASAQSSIPTSVEIKNLVISNLTTMSIGELRVYDFNLSVEYNDPDFIENFYDLRLSQEVYPYRLTSTGDTMFMETIAKSLMAPDEALNDIRVAGQASVLIKDKPEGGVNIHLQSRINPSREAPGKIVAELRTVSRPYYDFQRLLQREGQVFNGLTEPSVTSSFNVSSGYGVFAGFSQNTQKVNLAGY
ncbi:DUF4249 domain-containing protein [Neolewinella agarilytica]|uniref:DUF4249 domain-containing protein n=1 Tax=Neolewinella agarilytica TaxID=478744 RepID=A0A1H9P0W4_9BACT|nr:DUF4249 domain-containing protein [Neolewinella agarilytica]SER41555.1 protein of unknown function [Neolewinella agarilytica]